MEPNIDKGTVNADMTFLAIMLVCALVPVVGMNTEVISQFFVFMLNLWGV